jgi:hypothetical protein
MIFLVPADELPTAFVDAKDIGDFIGARFNSDLRLRMDTRGGAVFAELENRAIQFALTSFHWIQPFDGPDQEIDQSFYIKRLPAEQYEPLCRDIDSLISVARSSPRLFDISSCGDPRVEKSMYDFFAETVNSDDVIYNLDECYENSGTWDLLFPYLRAVRSICNEAQDTHKVVLQVCVG